MTWFSRVAMLVVAYLAVVLQTTWNDLRLWLGVQVDLLPSLMVYASLSSGVVAVSVLAICGGLWIDSLSANPLGASVLPLFLVGLFLQRSRDLILGEQRFAQFILGAAASAAVPLFTLLLLINLGVRPLIGWSSLWQWLVMAVVGGLVTPGWFWFFRWIGEMLNYRALSEPSFRADREIKRGRS